MKKNMCFFVFLCLFYLLQLPASDKMLIGISGGTASGKTTIAKKIHENFSTDVLIISQDNYYKDISHLSPEERNNRNFDHPDAIDFDLLQEHISQLLEGKSIEQPIYDFTTHGRLLQKNIVYPKKIIIVEGMLLFTIPVFRDFFDLKIFVETDADIRFIRRLERDIKERGRTLEQVKEQYINTVHPMYHLFIEPSKRYADIIIPFGGINHSAMELMFARIKEHLQSFHGKNNQEK